MTARMERGQLGRLVAALAAAGLLGAGCGSGEPASRGGTRTERATPSPGVALAAAQQARRHRLPAPPHGARTKTGPVSAVGHGPRDGAARGIAAMRHVAESCTASRRGAGATRRRPPDGDLRTYARRGLHFADAAVAALTAGGLPAARRGELEGVVHAYRQLRVSYLIALSRVRPSDRARLARFIAAQEGAARFAAQQAGVGACGPLGA